MPSAAFAAPATYRIEHDADWPRERIEALLDRAATCTTFADRFRVLVQPFIEAETPYARPTEIPSHEPGVLSLRLSAFSCSSFTHFLAALAHARDYDEFVRTVALRYGNKVHPRSFIYDIGGLMAAMGGAGLISSLAHLGGNGRNRWLNSASVERIEPLLNCGDMLFFRSAAAATEGAKAVTHTAFVYKFDDSQREAFIIHAGATEHGPISRKRGCVVIARQPKDSASSPIEIPIPLHDYLATKRRYFSHVAVYRLQRSQENIGYASQTSVEANSENSV